MSISPSLGINYSFMGFAAGGLFIGYRQKIRKEVSNETQTDIFFLMAILFAVAIALAPCSTCSTPSSPAPTPSPPSPPATFTTALAKVHSPFPSSPTPSSDIRNDVRRLGDSFSLYRLQPGFPPLRSHLNTHRVLVSFVFHDASLSSPMVLHRHGARVLSDGGRGVHAA